MSHASATYIIETTFGHNKRPNNSNQLYNLLIPLRIMAHLERSCRHAWLVCLSECLLNRWFGKDSACKERYLHCHTHASISVLLKIPICLLPPVDIGSVPPVGFCDIELLFTVKKALVCTCVYFLRIHPKADKKCLLIISLLSKESV